MVIRAGKERAIGEAQFSGLDVRGKAVIVATGWDSNWKTEQYFDGHPYLTRDAARLLAESGAAMVGIDSLNIDDTGRSDAARALDPAGSRNSDRGTFVQPGRLARRRLSLLRRAREGEAVRHVPCARIRVAVMHNGLMFRCDIGDNIELRPFEEYHAEELFAAVERNREHLRRWLPWVDRTLAVEDVQNFLARAIEAFSQGEELHAGIFIHGKLAGTIGHHRYRRAQPERQYRLLAGRYGRRQGCDDAMLSRYVRYLFEERRMHRVEIRCATGNTRSCAIPQRLGFTRDGVLREAEWVNDCFLDLVVWSLLDREYFDRAEM